MELCKGRTLAEQYNELLAMYKGGLSAEEIHKLNEYREEISRYKDKFSEELKYGSDNLKFSLRFTQLRIINEYNSYKEQLIETHPEYKGALDNKEMSP